MTNTMLEFYLQNHITTEHIDVAHWNDYLRKRKNLYRQLGIPMLAIKGSEILEVGPGAGHNSIPLIIEGARSIDLVEPNPVAREALEDNFKRMEIKESAYIVHPVTLEEYSAKKKYDIVIAEGYVQSAQNWKEFMAILKTFTKENSIVIVTCMDEIGLYLERMKRFVGRYIVRDMEDFKAKKEKLVEIFSEPLKKLKGMTRSAEEWVMDIVFCDTTIYDNFMSIKDAMYLFREEFDVLGCSQNMFTDYSWYKDLDYDYIASYIEQYDRKRNMFLVAGEYEERPGGLIANNRLAGLIREVNRETCDIEQNDKRFSDLYRMIDQITECSGNVTVKQYNKELKDILHELESGRKVDLMKYPIWNKKFGKSMQYISFQHR